MTEKEIYNLPERTPVKIKSDVECADFYKEPCELAFKLYDKGNEDSPREYGYGISTFKDGRAVVCYQFHSSDYELA